MHVNWNVGKASAEDDCLERRSVHYWRATPQFENCRFEGTAPVPRKADRLNDSVLFSQRCTKKVERLMIWRLRLVSNCCLKDSCRSSVYSNRAVNAGQAPTPARMS